MTNYRLLLLITVLECARLASLVMTHPHTALPFIVDRPHRDGMMTNVRLKDCWCPQDVLQPNSTMKFKHEEGGNATLTGFTECVQKEVTSLTHSDIKVKVIALLWCRCLGWVGESIFASLSTFQQARISKRSTTNLSCDHLLRVPQ